LDGGGALGVEVCGSFRAQISAVSSAGSSAPRYSAMRKARSETPGSWVLMAWST
jgi:hypothetical protein